ncbi:MAG: DUF2961 domain-containing protein [Planctomycetota bacterium]|nr:DUF2961 domain-containing protein [Planctomycetota bacterium]
MRRRRRLHAPLRVYWDRDPNPAIECPVGEFFGTGFGNMLPGRGRKPVPVKYAAVPLGMTDGFYYFFLLRKVPGSECGP